MPRGGARPGAGRKKGPAKQSDETAIEAVRAQIRGHLPEIVATLLGQSQAGSVKASIYLVDRLMGRPTQPVNLGGQPGNPVALEYVNDWRHTLETDSAPLPAPGAANGKDPVEAA